MSLLNAFNAMSNAVGDTTESFQSMTDYQPTYTESPAVTPVGWEEEFKGIRLYPSLYNFDGFISSQPYSNWGTASPIIAQMAEDMRNIIEPNKIEPNKIFTAETQQLRKISADQLRIIKMFEKKFMEAMTEKGKFGITEEDVLAFNALVAARAQMTNNTKEQVAIKKSIAELKIKQQQAIKQAAGNANNNDTGSSMPMNAQTIGRSVLDSIFSMDTSSQQVPTSGNNDYTNISSVDANNILDSLISSAEVTSPIQYESLNPKTYVVIGDNDNDVEFQTYSSTGELIPDYPNPTSKITNIDKDTGKATDDLLVQYDIKYRDEL